VAGGEAQLARGFLLQRRGGERGAGLRLNGLVSISSIVKLAASTAALAALALPSSPSVNLSSFLPWYLTSRASNSLPSCCSLAMTDQYSSARKRSISISRSTISRRATDCTRPALFAPGSRRHSTGESVKP
jgi:hypothetical protein